MLADLIERAMSWQQSTYQCSAPSHIFLYVLIACWILISAGGVFSWFRFIRRKPQKLAT